MNHKFLGNMRVSPSTRSLKFFVAGSVAIVSLIMLDSCGTVQDTTGPARSIISIENQHEGTTEWLIDVPYKQCQLPDHQNCRRPQVEGYCSQTSYFAGDTLRIFVSTDPPSVYTLDIYRIGYYGGKGGRLMRSAGQLEGKAQIVPQAGKNNLIECNWETGYSMVIPQDWVSGVYAEGLLRTRVFLSVGHDEYWTPDMFDNVTGARDAGVNIMFLAGNSVDGTVYLEESSDGLPHRITGRLPQREFDNEDELMGNSSYGVGYADIALKNTDHWVFEGTGIKDGDTLKNLVGWEYHGYPLKKDSTLVVLGLGKIKPNKFASEDAADHAMVLYTAEKGNFVFNAGTCFWSLPLSSPPGYKNPVNNQGELGKEVLDFSKEDPRIQQIMRNLLARALAE